jgi:uracil-DNA glycosylase
MTGMTKPHGIAPRTLFVGESPPPNSPADFRPFNCDSGKRLARAMGLRSLDVLLQHVPRANIFDAPAGVPGCPKWEREAARKNGGAILLREDGNEAAPSIIVALGRRVVAAFGHPDLPEHAWTPVPMFTHLIALPHPSGRSQSLKDEHHRAEYRRAALPELIAGCHTLRPWHFDLDTPTVLADLGTALVPNDHALGVAWCIVASEMHRAMASVGDPWWDAYRAACDVPMVDVARCLHNQPILTAIERLIDPTMTKKVASELKARVVFAERSVPAPSSEFRRAVMGRYAALGMV